jgi:hypothetical protein
MTNRAIEFHDSTFDGVEREGGDVALRFSAAYIHQSEGEPARMQVRAGYKNFVYTFQTLRSAVRFLIVPVISGMVPSHWTTSGLIIVCPFHSTTEDVSRSTLCKTAVASGTARTTEIRGRVSGSKRVIACYVSYPVAAPKK